MNREDMIHIVFITYYLGPFENTDGSQSSLMIVVRMF